MSVRHLLSISGFFSLLRMFPVCHYWAFTSMCWVVWLLRVVCETFAEYKRIFFLSVTHFFPSVITSHLCSMIRLLCYVIVIVVIITVASAVSISLLHQFLSDIHCLYTAHCLKSQMLKLLGCGADRNFDMVAFRQNTDYCTIVLSI